MMKLAVLHAPILSATVLDCTWSFGGFTAMFLQADDEAVLLRLGLAVMAALQQSLLELEDFEALITHLKVCSRHEHNFVYHSSSLCTTAAVVYGSCLAPSPLFQLLL
jgi:hypothetical protein